MARSIWNKCIDKYPYIILKCIGLADVLIPVRLAKKLSMPLSVRCGDHSIVGHGFSCTLF